MSNAVLARLHEERGTQVEFIDQTLARVDAESRDLVPAETDNLNAARERIKALDAQIAPLEEFESLRNAHQSSGAPAFRATQPQDGQQGRGLAARTEAREYEYRSAGELLADAFCVANEGDQSLRGAVRTEGARNRLESAGLTISNHGQLQRAAVPHTTTAEVPGLLPVSINGPLLNDIDAARPFVSSIGAKDLGGIPGTAFKRPIVTTHVGVAVQSAEKAELEDGQFIVGSVDFTKQTFGGWTNVSRQAIDWTSPAAWDALMQDFLDIYAQKTENAAADAFVTAVSTATDTEVVDNTALTIKELYTGLYTAAAASYGVTGRLPDTIWASLDQWIMLGTVVDVLQTSNTMNTNTGNTQALDSFAGNLARINRVIVPSFTSGTLIIGPANRTEFYEDRIGFLTAVEPKVLGVELAYGGYVAYGTLKPTAYRKLTFTNAA